MIDLSANYCFIFGNVAYVRNNYVERIRYKGLQRFIYRKFGGVFCRVLFSPNYVRKLINCGELYCNDIGGGFICLQRNR